MVLNARNQTEELSQAEREKLPKSAFVFPDRMAWPIHDEEHAKIALSYMKMGRGDAADYPKVRAAIKKRYPDFATEEAIETPTSQLIAGMHELLRNR